MSFDDFDVKILTRRARCGSTFNAQVFSLCNTLADALPKVFLSTLKQKDMVINLPVLPHWKHGVKRFRHDDCQYVKDELLLISLFPIISSEAL